MPALAVMRVLHVAAPRQRVKTVALEHAVNGNGQARDDNDVTQASNLLGMTQVGHDRQRNHDVGEKAVRALQPLIGAEPTDKGRHAKERANQVGDNQQANRQQKRRAPERP